MLRMISSTEAVWRHLLVAALDEGDRRTTITELSRALGMPISTIHTALERPRAIGAVRGSATGIRVLDPKRLQLMWAVRRDLARDVTFRTRVPLNVKDIELQLPPEAIPTAFTAFVAHAGRNVVADYEQVIVYADSEQIRKRYGERRGEPNLICLEPDALLPRYGRVASRPQVYADLFNLPSWQAQRFLEVLDREWLENAA